MAQSGIYFLYLDGVVVYVGQAVNVRTRIGQHIAEGVKHFDSVSFIPCRASRLTAVENYYIRAISPSLNKCGLAEAVRRESLVSATERKSTQWEAPLNSADAAEFLGVNHDTFSEWRRQGLLPRGRRLPVVRLHVYRPSELLRFAQDNAQLIARHALVSDRSSGC